MCKTIQRSILDMVAAPIAILFVAIASNYQGSFEVEVYAHGVGARVQLNSLNP